MLGARVIAFRHAQHGLWRGSYWVTQGRRLQGVSATLGGSLPMRHLTEEIQLAAVLHEDLGMWPWVSP